MTQLWLWLGRVSAVANMKPPQFPIVTQRGFTMNDSYDWHEHVQEHPAQSAMITLAIYVVLIAVGGALPVILSLS
jgi:hypothetical protein